MQQVKKQTVKLISNQQVWVMALIVIGLGFTLFFGIRAVRSYRQLVFLQEQGLEQGTASVEAIRPWMTVRYVSVAYAVPEEYIFAQLEIPFSRRNSNDTLGYLNRTYELGWSSQSGYPVIVDKIAQAILDYRTNPVATGLDDIRPWMSLRYIANSSGVPLDYLLTQLGLGAGDNYAAQPLAELAELIEYQTGKQGLVEAVRTALAQYEAEP